jgi:hypothetical protein
MRICYRFPLAVLNEIWQGNHPRAAGTVPGPGRIAAADGHDVAELDKPRAAWL